MTNDPVRFPGPHPGGSIEPRDPQNTPFHQPLLTPAEASTIVRDFIKEVERQLLTARLVRAANTRNSNSTDADYATTHEGIANLERALADLHSEFGHLL